MVLRLPIPVRDILLFLAVLETLPLVDNVGRCPTSSGLTLNRSYVVFEKVSIRLGYLQKIAVLCDVSWVFYAKSH